MGEQLRLFKLTPDELEKKAQLLAMLDLEIIGLEEQRKEAQQELRESTEAEAVRDLRAQIKDANHRKAKVLAEIRAAARAPFDE